MMPYENNREISRDYGAELGEAEAELTRARYETAIGAAQLLIKVWESLLAADPSSLPSETELQAALGADYVEAQAVVSNLLAGNSLAAAKPEEPVAAEHPPARGQEATAAQVVTPSTQERTNKAASVYEQRAWAIGDRVTMHRIYSVLDAQDKPLSGMSIKALAKELNVPDEDLESFKEAVHRITYANLLVIDNARKGLKPQLVRFPGRTTRRMWQAQTAEFTANLDRLDWVAQAKLDAAAAFPE